MVWEYIAEHGLVTVGIHILERIRRVRFLQCRLVQPNIDIRVSFSALLRISQGGRYLLVQNLHRPELYGPFGGVFKYYDAARKDLDAIEFKPQDFGPANDMANDLRGFIPRKYLGKLCKWYFGATERETAAECVSRELGEELTEIGLPNRLRVPPTISLRRVRLVEEGPERVPGQKYTQFRVFEVYEPADAKAAANRFFSRLYEAAQDNEHLVTVSAEEIEAGRASGNQLIGHHTAYLIGSKRIRGEDPPFAHRI